jgi:hypothetical protein
MDWNDPVARGAALDSRRYAQDVRRHMLNLCAAAREAEC